MATVAERIREVYTEAQAIAAKGVLSESDSATFAQLIAEGDSLQAQASQLKKFGDFESFAQSSAGTLPLAANGVSVLSGGQAGETVVTRTKAGTLLEQYGEGIYSDKLQGTIGTTAYRDAFKSYLKHGKDVGGTHLKTLQEAADTSGGFMVPSDMLDRVISKEPTPTRVAGKVTQLSTGRDQLLIPRVNYTADDLYTTGVRVTFTGETPASSTAARVTDPVFGRTQIPVFTAMLTLPITNDLIEDSQFPLISYITGKFAETIDLLRDNLVLNGTGQGQASGILLNPGDAAGTQPALVKSGLASALSADGIIDLAYALPEQYDENACFVMNKVSGQRSVAKLKTTTNEYLFRMGLQDNGIQGPSLRNGMLLGYDICLSGFMPNVAAGTTPVIFGDLRGYYMVNRIGLSIQVLRELYAETNQIMLVGRIRLGGQVAEAYRIKVQNVSA